MAFQLQHQSDAEDADAETKVRWCENENSQLQDVSEHGKNGRRLETQAGSRAQRNLTFVPCVIGNRTDTQSDFFFFFFLQLFV